MDSIEIPAEELAEDGLDQTIEDRISPIIFRTGQRQTRTAQEERDRYKDPGREIRN